MKLADLFLTIQGEALFSGIPTVFIRTAFCPFACAWPCDTGFTKETHWIAVKHEMTPEQIVKEIRSKWKTRCICLTGGEPLADKESEELVCRLVENGYSIAIETSGLYPFLKFLLPRVHLIVDLKCPSSQEHEKNRYVDWQHLRSGVDQIKAVISDRNDYEFATGSLIKWQPKCEVLYSPAWSEGQGPLIAKELAGWILEDQLGVRLQLQLHKIIGVS